MSEIEQIITIILMSIITFFTRSISFMIFPDNKKLPKIIHYLQDVLPYAIFGLLIVYCLRDVSIVQANHGLPEIIGIIIVVLLYLSTKNSLIAIFVGTIGYMLMVQFIFI